MTTDDLQDVAEQAIDAIVDLCGPGRIVAMARNGKQPGLSMCKVQYLPGGEAEAVKAVSEDVWKRGVKAFMTPPDTPGSSTVVTDQGISVRVASYIDVHGKEFGQITVLGVGKA